MVLRSGMGGCSAEYTIMWMMITQSINCHARLSSTVKAKERQERMQDKRAVHNGRLAQ